VFRFLSVFLRCLHKLPFAHLCYLAKRLRNERIHKVAGKYYVNSFFPPYPGRAFEKFLDSAIQRKRVPYSTYFAVTDKCPYNCPHCSYASRTPGQLSTAQTKNVIEQIKSIGTVTIGFTGGEPLLRDDIVELVSSCGDEIATVIFTTGYGLTESLCTRLKHAGIGCLMIGIESDLPKEHDKVRGANGSFDQAIKAIEMSLSAGIYTAISTVATREKIASGQVQRLAQMAQTMHVHEFRILEPVATGAICGDMQWMLSPEESRTLYNFHKTWNRHNHNPAISGFSYLESDEMFGCGVGFHHLFIDAIGNVCPCDLTPLSFGNVLQKPLAEIWSEMGKIFSSPRCQCIMRKLAPAIAKSNTAGPLPLSTEKSIKLCNALPPENKLPAVYKRLFKGLKP
jgi:MoaA/NifB/PqqE/SkfB family radical SAM enzyme